MLSFFGLHDREKFEVRCYSYGPEDSSRYRNQIMEENDQFIDICERSHIDVAKRIYADGVDILVDLKGHTKGSRLGILACRSAPVQVHFIGYPGTTGADFIDYFITDRIVTPEDHDPYYSEKLIFLPHCYQVNDHQRNRSVPPEIFLRRDRGGSDTFSTTGYRLSNILPGILIPQPACFNDA
jgi:protein O-GlcNAc transferase